MADDDAELDALWRETVGPALLCAVDSLGAEERVAFALRVLFGVPEDEVAEIVRGCPEA